MKRRFALFRWAAVLCGSSAWFASAEILPPGNRPLPPGVHALVGGKVVLQPGVVLENATVLVRDGVIEQVGTNVTVPAEARVWDSQGLTIYPGLIDAYLTLGSVRSASGGAKAGAGGQRDDLTAGRFYGVPGNEPDRGQPGPGGENPLVTPERRMAEEYAPDTKLLDGLRGLGFTAGNIVPEKGVIRGSSAFVILGDMEPNRAILKPDVFQHITLDADGRKEDAFPDSLMGIIALIRQTFLDAEHAAVDQADYLKNPNRKRPDFDPSLAALLPVERREMRVIFDPQDALMVDRVRHIAEEAKINYLLLSGGEEWRRPEFVQTAGVPCIVPVNFPEVSKMPDEDDWQQLSLDQLRAWDWAPENPALIRQQGVDVALTTYGLGDKGSFRKNLKAALERGLSEDDALAALTTVPAKLCGVDKMVGTIEAGKLANLTVVEGSYFDPEAKIREIWVEGRNYHQDLSKKAEPKKDEAPKDEKTRAEKEKKDAEKKELAKRVAQSPLTGRGSITNPPAVLVQNTIIWTQGKEGILTNASLLAVNGKILAVSTNRLQAPANALVIDAQGKHLTPGLIDCHSHSAILGGVNEGSLPSTAMVRIGDVVNSETDNLREELAGGLTVANLLHGSANPIGGQNQVIKLRDGLTPEELKFAGAIPGIKFALGENVKQANWGEKYTTRFPQTRMGVPTFIANRFRAAQAYAAAWQEFQKANGSGRVPPRRDLELDTLVEILRGQRLIHCHSYRQDEILAFLRVMEGFQVKIGTLQHVLEGYKVADEIAAHGAGGSTFADWWAYKYEVIDGIPQSGAIMRDRGVVVSFNSDSPDLSRRMNLEAAKAVKFGNVPEEEALKFVTINPAKQLRIDNRVGSLEEGKDADFALWSGSPLATASLCEQTWIDGKKYFDRDVATVRATAWEAERQALLAKAKKVAGVDGGGKGGDEEAKKKFFRTARVHRYDRVTRHCEDHGED